MKTILLENEVCLAEISAQAAEVHRFYDKSRGIETIWCGDPQQWANRNPILFPHLGSLPQGKMVIEGKEYHYNYRRVQEKV